MSTIQLTPKGYKQLQEELVEIMEKTLPHAKDRLGKARAMGDLSENSEYHAAKEELGFADGRRREIEAILKQATVVEEQSNDDIVSLGKTVTVKRVGGDEETYSMVGEFEANPTERKLSSTSPIGAAFMGAHVGQTVTATVPAGSISFEILSIS